METKQIDMGHLFTGSDSWLATARELESTLDSWKGTEMIVCRRHDLITLLQRMTFVIDTNQALTKRLVPVDIAEAISNAAEWITDVMQEGRDYPTLAIQGLQDRTNELRDELARGIAALCGVGDAIVRSLDEVRRSRE